MNSFKDMKQIIRSSVFVIALWSIVGVIQSRASKPVGEARPTVSVLGDSYSTFEGFITPDSMETWYFARPDLRRTDVVKVGQTWWHQVVRRMGWKLERNNSWSGATICYSGYNDEDYKPRSFITRLDDLGSPDVILVFGGTNDSWANSPIGEFKYEGWRRADLYTFRPAMAYLLDHLIERYPTADIVFIANSELKDEITGSMKTICDHYKVPMIQLRDIEKQNGHPNIKGMQQIADQLVSFLKK